MALSLHRGSLPAHAYAPPITSSAGACSPSVLTLCAPTAPAWPPAWASQPKQSHLWAARPACRRHARSPLCCLLPPSLGGCECCWSTAVTRQAAPSLTLTRCMRRCCAGLAALPTFNWGTWRGCRSGVGVPAVGCVFCFCAALSQAAWAMYASHVLPASVSCQPRHYGPWFQQCTPSRALPMQGAGAALEQCQVSMAGTVPGCGLRCDALCCPGILQAWCLLLPPCAAPPVPRPCSIAIHMHGASLGNYFFLPRNAVAVQVRKELSWLLAALPTFVRRLLSGVVR